MDDPQRTWDRLYSSISEYMEREDKKEDFVKLCNFVGQCAPVFMTAKSNSAIFETLCKLEKEVTQILNETNVSDALQHIEDCCPKDNEQFQQIWNECKELSDKDSIITAMDKFKVDQANNMVMEMSKVAAIISIFQFFKLFNNWKKIRKASNYIKDEKRFELIKTGMAEMREMLGEIVTMFENDPHDRRIDRKVTIFNTKYTSTTNLIRCEKVKIDGHIKEISIIVESSFIDGAAGATNASLHAYQMYKAWEFLTSPSKFFGVLSLGSLAVSTIGNIITYNVSSENLQKLQQELDEVNRLKEEVDSLHEQVAQLMEQAGNMIN